MYHTTTPMYSSFFESTPLAVVGNRQRHWQPTIHLSYTSALHELSRGRLRRASAGVMWALASRRLCLCGAQSLQGRDWGGRNWRWRGSAPITRAGAKPAPTPAVALPRLRPSAGPAHVRFATGPRQTPATGGLYYNQNLDKKTTKKILSWFLDNYGPSRTSAFLEELKSVGFHYATEAGISLGFDDLKIPPRKNFILDQAENQITHTELFYRHGRMTAIERYQAVIDIWTTASEKLKEEVIAHFQSTDLFNPLYMMAFSGARGNISQVRQLVGMRGLMSDSAGGIIDFPIRKNFREGLTITEYVISCYGARKGLIDTALRTADSGYLTRRLVDVAHGIMIGTMDCGTREAFTIYALKAPDSNLVMQSLEKRILGRVRAGTNEEISPALAYELRWDNRGEGKAEAKPALFAGPGKLRSSLDIRSPLTCQTSSLDVGHTEDICQLCYGWSLAHGRLVSLGEAVGILAAQSIGEPGTQLTMRTFHTGGIFAGGTDAKLFAPHDGFVSFASSSDLDMDSGKLKQNRIQGKKIRTSLGQTAFFSFEKIQLKITSSATSRRDEEQAWVWAPQSSGEADATRNRQESYLSVPAYSLLFVYPGQEIRKHSLCAEISYLMQAKASVAPETSFVIRGETLVPATALPFTRPEAISLVNGKAVTGTSFVNELVSGAVEVASPYWGTGDSARAEARACGGADMSFAPVAPTPALPAGPDLASPRSAPGNREDIASVVATQAPAGNAGFASALAVGAEPRHSQLRPREAQASQSRGEAHAQASPQMMTKKVLSDIEGQVYFHRIAERRQKTGVEDIRHVKGVGSLWVLNGSLTSTQGNSQCGDFFLHSSQMQQKMCNGGSDSSTLSLLRNWGGSVAWAQLGRSPFRRPLRGRNATEAPSQNTSLPRLPQLQLRNSTAKKHQLRGWGEDIIAFQKSKNRIRSSESLRQADNSVGVGFAPAGKPLFAQAQYRAQAGLRPHEAHANAYSTVALRGLRPSGAMPQLSVGRPLVRSNNSQVFFVFWSRDLQGAKPIRSNNVLYNGHHSLQFAMSPSNLAIRARAISQSLGSAGYTDVVPRVAQASPQLRPYEAFAAIVLARPKGELRGKYIPEANNLAEGRGAISGESRASQSRGVAQALQSVATADGSSSARSTYMNSLSLHKKHLRQYWLDSSNPHTDTTQGRNTALDIRLGAGFAPAERSYASGPRSAAAPPPQSPDPTTVLPKLGDSLRGDYLAQVIVKVISHRNVSAPWKWSSSAAGATGGGSVASPREAPSQLPMSAPPQASTKQSHRNYAAIARILSGLRPLGVEVGAKVSRRPPNLFTSPLPLQRIQLIIRKIQPYVLSNEASLLVHQGEGVRRRQILCELFFEKSKTGDIVQGLPKIEQLFEARRTSAHVQDAIHLRLKSNFIEASKFYSQVEAAGQAIRSIQRILVDEIQMVYQSQGVDISDKHIEIIVRQMTSKVIILDSGVAQPLGSYTNASSPGRCLPFYPDDILEYADVVRAFTKNTSKTSEINTFSGYDSAAYEPIVLGITKRAFLSESWASSASFQEAKKVLMESACESKIDFLSGLKSNLIVGRYIRAGTSFRE